MIIIEKDFEKKVLTYQKFDSNQTVITIKKSKKKIRYEYNFYDSFGKFIFKIDSKNKLIGYFDIPSSRDANLDRNLFKIIDCNYQGKKYKKYLYKANVDGVDILLSRHVEDCGDGHNYYSLVPIFESFIKK